MSGDPGRCLLVGAALLALACPGPASAKRRQKPPKSAMEQGLAQLNNMEDRKALESFKEALQDAEDARDKAALHIHMGWAHFNLMDREAASASFRAALELAPEAALPEQLSPKIRALFKEEQDKLKAEEEARRKEKAAKARARAAAKARARAEAEAKRRREQRDSTQGGYKISAWTMLGVALAAGGAGAGMAAWGQSLEGDAEDLSRPYAEAEDLHDQASTRYLVANILFGVAGAAAVTSGVLLYFGYRSLPEANVSLVPLEGGAMVHVGGVRW